MLFPLLSILLIADRAALHPIQQPISLQEDEFGETLETACDLNPTTGTWYCPLLTDEFCFSADSHGQITLPNRTSPLRAKLDMLQLGSNRIIANQPAFATVGSETMDIEVPNHVATLINDRLGTTRRGPLDIVDCNILHTLPTISFTLSNGLFTSPGTIQWTPNDYIIRVGGSCVSPFKGAEDDSKDPDLSPSALEADPPSPHHELEYDEGLHNQSWPIGDIYTLGIKAAKHDIQEAVVIQLDDEQAAECSKWREEGTAMCQADIGFEEREENSSIRMMKYLQLAEDYHELDFAPMSPQPKSFFMHVPTTMSRQLNKKINARQEGSYWAVECGSITSLPELSLGYTEDDVEIPNTLRPEEYIIRVGDHCLSPFMDIGTELPAFDIGDVFLHRYSP